MTVYSHIDPNLLDNDDKWKPLNLLVPYSQPNQNPIFDVSQCIYIYTYIHITYLYMYIYIYTYILKWEDGMLKMTKIELKPKHQLHLEDDLEKSKVWFQLNWDWLGFASNGAVESSLKIVLVWTSESQKMTMFINQVCLRMGCIAKWHQMAI